MKSESLGVEVRAIFLPSASVLQAGAQKRRVKKRQCSFCATQLYWCNSVQVQAFLC